MLQGVLSSFATLRVLLPSVPLVSHPGRRAAAVHPSQCPLVDTQEGSNEQQSCPSASRDRVHPENELYQ